MIDIEDVYFVKAGSVVSASRVGRWADRSTHGPAARRSDGQSIRSGYGLLYQLVSSRPYWSPKKTPKRIAPR